MPPAMMLPAMMPCRVLIHHFDIAAALFMPPADDLRAIRRDATLFDAAALRAMREIHARIALCDDELSRHYTILLN